MCEGERELDSQREVIWKFVAGVDFQLQVWNSMPDKKIRDWLDFYTFSNLNIISLDLIQRVLCTTCNGLGTQSNLFI